MQTDILSALSSSNQLPNLNKTSMDQYNTIKGLAGKERLKIWISDEGLYVLPLTFIEDAGFKISGKDPRYFRVFNKNGEVPIRIVGGNDGSFDFTDYIEFYGEPIWDYEKENEKRMHVYSTKNVYWLEISDRLGLRMGYEDVHLTGNSIQSARSTCI